jgi:hypothetical protein
VAVFFYAVAGSADAHREPFVAEEGQSLLDYFFGVVDDGVAVGFLVAGVDQGVDGERVVFGGGDFFFEERSEDADFGGVEGF